ncbi:MAG: hypothetical protein FWD97_02020 [Defluviitaleaceae bacterium]|nr:hypothetical protein [Defluviitaleaceae bacterium]
MTIYQEKARMLAEEVLVSDISKDYAHAFAEYEENTDDGQAQERFLRARAEYQVMVESVVGMIRTVTGVDEAPSGGGCGGCCGGRR